MPLTLGEAAHTDLELFGVLVIIAALLVAAYRFRVPYPILLVIGGAGIGFMPGLPSPELEPDLVLIIFLPPLLYAAAFFSSLRDLRASLAAISWLAIGCVLATMVAVAVVAHVVVPALGWPAAFVLGAILSPTDAVAATAIGDRVGAPPGFRTVVEGESLVNDSTALIAYKFAVAAVLSGTFSLLDATGDFVVNAAGGVAIGLAVGVVLAYARRMIDDPLTEIALSLVTPFAAYLPAEAAGVSAVLAAVTAGIYLGWNSPWIISPETRLRATSVWEVIQFVLNAALFTLVGLELPHVIDGISGDYSATELVRYGVATSLTVIAVRFAWVFLTSLVPEQRLKQKAMRDWRGRVLVSWAGMRGGVSLAAALALPLTIDGGGPFPQRDLIIFLTCCVIFATLVLQGITLPALIRNLGIREAKARIKTARAALARLDELEGEDWTREATVERMRGLYDYRIRRFSARFDPEDDGDIDAGSHAYQRLRRETLEAERAEVIRLRNAGVINDDVMHRIERDLDLEDLRLEI